MLALVLTPIVYNFTIMPRSLLPIVALLLILCALFLISVPTQAAPAAQATATPSRFSQPPTVLPPLQADNGAQLYWSMCIDCHGDHGQGLTEEWRASFAPELRDCWGSGCHASVHPANSFEIPLAGVPALAGPGKLARFNSAFDLHEHIYKFMPLFPGGSLSQAESWSLTAYILRINDRQPAGLTLNAVNSAAIPIHRKVSLPANSLPGALILSLTLGLAALGLILQARHAPARVQPARPNFFHHLHPPSIPAEQARLGYTLGAGGLAVFFSLILLVTGLLEMYYYIPTPEQAAISVQTITYLVPFGALIRNLHYWSAQFLVLVAVVHLLRVVLTGAYAAGRRSNYLIGLSLLVMILLLDFTGYVLRWDEGIRWALVVGTNLLRTIPWLGEGLYLFVMGANEPGPPALTRFYAWHIFGLALVSGIFIIWHIFRVRRDGGIAVPPAAVRSSRQRITRFELLRRELLIMSAASVLLLLFSALIPAPLAQPISAGSTFSAESRAPWFFLWVQWLLKLGDPFLWGVLVPILVFLCLALLPTLLPGPADEQVGRWFSRGNRLAQGLAVLIVLAILALTVLGAISR